MLIFSTSTSTHTSNRGFTLIEVMIAVIIIGIIASIAIPSYQKYIIQSRRAEAQAYVSELALRVERERANSSTYQAIACHTQASIDFYTFCATPGVNAATQYVITGTATGTQLTQDGACSPLTLDQSGTRLPANCW